MSGLSHTPGKRARGKTLRGFESRLLRQLVNRDKEVFVLSPQFSPHIIASWLAGTLDLLDTFIAR